MLRVLKPGLQTTLQGAPRIGWRHLGFPYSGPADPLSMALANRLVDNMTDETCIEITFGGFEAEVTEACTIALTGAEAEVRVSGQAVPCHATLHLRAADTIMINAPKTGVRTYLAVHSGFQADHVFGSSSTYLPAAFGGHQGRMLKPDDVLRAKAPPRAAINLKTPMFLRPVFTHSFALRACPSAETHLLEGDAVAALFETNFQVDRQVTRMGISLAGQPLIPESQGLMQSAPVFPGTIQGPPSGRPIILLCDAQTTGGYPRIAMIARCDRHLLGQARPGDHIRLLKRTPETATRDYIEKRAFISDWLGL